MSEVEQQVAEEEPAQDAVVLPDGASAAAEPADAPADPGEQPDAPSAGNRRTGPALTGAIEALLLMAEEPMPASTLAAALDVPEEIVRDALGELVRFYDDTQRGFELRHLGGGWRYYTREEHADVIAEFVLSGQTARLSQAALETLSVIAYTQPISRSRVAAVRGVNVDGVIRTLMARDLIEEAGQDPETGAVVFRTTEYFLERMGLSGLDDLPDLAPHLPEAADLEAELGELARRTEESPPEQHESPQSGEEAGLAESSVEEPSVEEPPGQAVLPKDQE